MPESGTAALSYEVFVSEPIPTTGTLPTGEPQLWSPLSTTLISGAADAVLVDPPFTREQTRQVGDWIERSGKRLSQIYVTHGHGDHWFGAASLAGRFPGAAVHATEGTIRLMHASVTGPRKAFWDKLFPGQIPDTPVVARPLPADGIVLEGHRLIPVEVGHSDCDDSTVLHVPALGLVVAGDVAYNNVHQYLADGGLDGGIDAWLGALDQVRALRPAAVVAGHKDPRRPDDPGILDETADYLRTAQRVLAGKPAPREFFDELTRRHPERLNPGTVWLNAQRLR
ncbi:MBL fold metallo-hydrolase [Amycolatopsis australiensis]|uniref:Glyoxylase, beta-lactamase superfamily II n=1 Tax=Amycolatopsis australiensis TaxID=546364 RepID=A0A1K1S6L5_9PSEU|nr:MBL fold metallo-hydrolase [Amycolatopsis australiensis]SFW79719.1 Glyoxylase, beta-lactamase superfamily II [Amycolatopsis australiensis]